MTFRAIRGSRPGTTRRGLTVGAVAAVGFLAAGCSAVTPAQNGSGAGAGGSASASGSADADAFGTPASADQVKNGGTLVMALSAEPDRSTRRCRAASTPATSSTPCARSSTTSTQTAQIVPQLATAPAQIVRRRQDRHHPAARRASSSPTARRSTRPRSRRRSSATSRSTAPAARASWAPSPASRRRTPRPWCVKLKTPFAPLTAALADRAGMILSPKALKTLGQRTSPRAPVCVGPFKFAKRVPQNSIEVVKDPNYYDAAKVHLDKITYRIITDANIRSANLRSGDVQVADSAVGAGRRRR